MVDTHSIPSPKLVFSSGTHYQPNTPSTIVFSVINTETNERFQQQEYLIVHEQPMHVIVVSHDLTHFQHVHPLFDTTTNEYTLADFVFPVPGPYRIFTDFVLAGSDHHSPVQFQDVIVGEGASSPPQPLGEPTFLDYVEDLMIKLDVLPGPSDLEKMLVFTITKDDQPVTDLQPYLGAMGHLVVLRAATLDYIHAHPLEIDATNPGKVTFHVGFTQKGNYKAFAQFQHDNHVLTSSFIVELT